MWKGLGEQAFGGGWVGAPVAWGAALRSHSTANRYSQYLSRKYFAEMRAAMLFIVEGNERKAGSAVAEGAIGSRLYSMALRGAGEFLFWALMKIHAKSII